MATQLPRISAYVSKEAHARFLALAKTHGLTPRQLLEGLIDGAFQDKRDWMAQQSGHQTMLTLALVTALAKRTLKDDEIAKVRHMGGQAGALLFGPLGKRPFTVEAPVPDDDRLLALFAALSE